RVDCGCTSCSPGSQGESYREKEGAEGLWAIGPPNAQGLILRKTNIAPGAFSGPSRYVHSLGTAFLNYRRISCASTSRPTRLSHVVDGGSGYDQRFSLHPCDLCMLLAACIAAYDIQLRKAWRIHPARPSPRYGYGLTGADRHNRAIGGREGDAAGDKVEELV